MLCLRQWQNPIWIFILNFNVEGRLFIYEQDKSIREEYHGGHIRDRINVNRCLLSGKKEGIK